MRSTSGAVLYFVICLAAIANPCPAQDKPKSPAEQFQTLLKQYQEASGSGTVLTDEERLKFIGEVYRLRYRLALKFVELAEKFPKDPIAVNALMQAVWQVNSTPWPVELVGRDEAAPRALALLERDHVESEKLGPTCQRLGYGFGREYGNFLRAVLDRNPHREVRAQACLALAHFLSGRLQRLALISQQPELERVYADLFGKDYLRELLRMDGEKANREADGLLERALADFGDVKIPDEGTVGEKARAELFEMRHLIVGKEAPDIEGEDQEGRKFKLSEYRGKVVLLDFWSEY